MSDYNLNDFWHNKKQFKDKGKDEPSPARDAFTRTMRRCQKPTRDRKKTITNRTPLVEHDKVDVAKPQT